MMVDKNKVRAGGKKRKASGAADYCEQFNLTSSLRQLHTRYGVQMGAGATLAYSTLCKRRRLEGWQYSLVSSLRVDVCDICYLWTHSVVPKIQALLKEIRLTLLGVQATYWDAFDSVHQVTSITEETIVAVVRYINSKAKWKVYFGTSLHKAEAAANKQLTLTCPELDGTAILDCVRWHYHHFASRDYQAFAWSCVWNKPSGKVLRARIDFAENFNLPVGPE